MLVTSSAISSAGSRANAAATARRCSSPPDRPPVSRSASPSRPTSVEQLVDVGARAGRQPPHHVVGDPGAEHLALRVLQDHRRAAGLAESDRRRAARWCPTVGSRPASISISVVLPEPLAPVIGDVLAGVRRSATPGRARRGRARDSGIERRCSAHRHRCHRPRPSVAGVQLVHVGHADAAGRAPATAPTNRSA